MNAKPTAKPSPLGRGLSALFGDTDGAYQPRAPLSLGTPAGGGTTTSATTAPAPAAKPGPLQMPITWLQPGAYQPRRKFAEEPLGELADSIREKGVLTPLLVRPIDGEKDQYEIVAGERRWRAAQEAGVHEVPVVVRPMTDQEAMEIGLIENVQREGLSVLEEAEGYRRLIEEFSYTQDTLGKVVGKSRSHLSNIMRLLNLPEKVKQLLDDGTLSLGHARVVAGSRYPEELAAEIVRRGMNVRQAEQALKREVENRKPGLKIANQKQAMAMQADLLALEKELQNATGLKVKIKPQGTKGTLTIFYQDFDQLDTIIQKLHSQTRSMA